MRNRIIFIFLILFYFAIFSEDKKVLVLCYHEVKDMVFDHYDPDTMAVSTENLIKQFSWFKGHNYNPVSLEDVILYSKGKGDLPDNPVLLTFDDGLKSFYTRVFPILKTYNYPAVSALMGKWLGNKYEIRLKYGGNIFTRDNFMTWDEIREIHRSGLVEFASHSYNLHRGAIGNLHGSMEPVAGTRLFDNKNMTYESDKDYKERIKKDLKKSSDLMFKELGKRPRAIVWPYGVYSRCAEKIACSVGFNISVTLDAGFWDPFDMQGGIQRIKRNLVSKNPSLDVFIWTLKKPVRYSEPLKLVHVDLDYLYDENKTQQSKNFDKLVERIKQLDIQVVFLQAFSDVNGDGCADSLYFPNKYMKVREDLFDRVSWQLKTRSGVEVYAWMPVSAFKLEKGHNPEYVKSLKPVKGDVPRLSLFSPKMKSIIKSIYADLAKYCHFDGVLFHDDAYFNDFEDASDSALKYYKKKWGIKKDILSIRNDDFLLDRWTELKTDYLIGFTKELMEVTSEFRGSLYFCRNIFAGPIISPHSETWFAQSYKKFLGTYDYTAVMAMPYMERAKEPLKWLENLVRESKKSDPKLSKTIFELQAKDWNTGKDVPVKTLLEQMDILILNGALNFGYYPDDFIRGVPELKEIRMGISLKSYPY